jgi:hypothetical protein
MKIINYQDFFTDPLFYAKVRGIVDGKTAEIQILPFVLIIPPSVVSIMSSAVVFDLNGERVKDLIDSQFGLVVYQAKHLSTWKIKDTPFFGVS